MRRRRIGPEALRRRAMLVDFLLAAALAALALSLAAGLGVVAFFALPVLLVCLVWIAVERLGGAVGRRRFFRSVR